MALKGVDEIQAAARGQETVVYQGARMLGASDTVARVVDVAAAAPDAVAGAGKGALRFAVKAGPRSGFVFSEEAVAKGLGEVAKGAGEAAAEHPEQVAAAGAKAAEEVAAATTAIAPSSVKEVLDRLPGKTGKTGPIKEVPDEQALNELFNSLSGDGKTIDSGTYPGIVRELPDGTIVRMRPRSRSGGATIDLTLPGGKIYKVHVTRS